MRDFVVLSDIEGFSRLSGVDEHGCNWLQAEVDYLAGEEDIECEECGNFVSSGWICLDGGNERCKDCVIIPDCLDCGLSSEMNLRDNAFTCKNCGHISTIHQIKINRQILLLD